jgi:HSP20 family molecular chaperone IbpA
MPGVPRDAIDIQVDRGILTIQGKSEIPGTPDPTRQEFKSTVYRREFHVADEVDVASITAKHQDGILTLTVPRGKATQAHKISVQ